jgi:hypothetical protein
MFDGWVTDQNAIESVVVESARKLAAADHDPPSIIIDVSDAAAAPSNLFDGAHDHRAPVRLKFGFSYSIL